MAYINGEVKLNSIKDVFMFWMGRKYYSDANYDFANFGYEPRVKDGIVCGFGEIKA